MPPEKHKGLETWQIVVGVAGVIVGILLFLKHEKAPAAEAALPTPTGVAGGGGGGSYGEMASAGGQAVKSPSLTGQQTNPTTPGPNQPAGPAPGESLHEWEGKHPPDQTTNPRGPCPSGMVVQGSQCVPAAAGMPGPNGTVTGQQLPTSSGPGGIHEITDPTTGQKRRVGINPLVPAQ
jgi:hypothetical protein